MASFDPLQTIIARPDDLINEDEKQNLDGANLDNINIDGDVASDAGPSPVNAGIEPPPIGEFNEPDRLAQGSDFSPPELTAPQLAQQYMAKTSEGVIDALGGGDISIPGEGEGLSDSDFASFMDQTDAVSKDPLKAETTTEDLVRRSGLELSEGEKSRGFEMRGIKGGGKIKVLGNFDPTIKEQVSNFHNRLILEIARDPEHALPALLKANEAGSILMDDKGEILIKRPDMDFYTELDPDGAEILNGVFPGGIREVTQTLAVGFTGKTAGLIAADAVFATTETAFDLVGEAFLGIDAPGTLLGKKAGIEPDSLAGRVDRFTTDFAIGATLGLATKGGIRVIGKAGTAIAESNLATRMGLKNHAKTLTENTVATLRKASDAVEVMRDMGFDFVSKNPKLAHYMNLSRSGKNGLPIHLVAGQVKAARAFVGPVQRNRDVLIDLENEAIESVDLATLTYLRQLVDPRDIKTQKLLEDHIQNRAKESDHALAGHVEGLLARARKGVGEFIGKFRQDLETKGKANLTEASREEALPVHYIKQAMQELDDKFLTPSGMVDIERNIPGQKGVFKGFRVALSKGEIIKARSEEALRNYVKGLDEKQIAYLRTKRGASDLDKVMKDIKKGVLDELKLDPILPKDKAMSKLGLNPKEFENLLNLRNRVYAELEIHGGLRGGAAIPKSGHHAQRPGISNLIDDLDSMLGNMSASAANLKGVKKTQGFKMITRMRAALNADRLNMVGRDAPEGFIEPPKGMNLGLAHQLRNDPESFERFMFQRQKFIDLVNNEKNLANLFKDPITTQLMVKTILDKSASNRTTLELFKKVIQSNDTSSRYGQVPMWERFQAEVVEEIFHRSLDPNKSGAIDIAKVGKLLFDKDTGIGERNLKFLFSDKAKIGEITGKAVTDSVNSKSVTNLKNLINLSITMNRFKTKPNAEELSLPLAQKIVSLVWQGPVATLRVLGGALNLYDENSIIAKSIKNGHLDDLISGVAHEHKSLAARMLINLSKANVLYDNKFVNKVLPKELRNNESFMIPTVLTGGTEGSRRAFEEHMPNMIVEAIKENIR